MHNKDIFLQSIYEKRLVSVTFNSLEKGRIVRTCIPYDFGPSRRNLKVNPDRFHLYDLDSPEENHNLSILPEQIISIEIPDQNFNPGDYVTWTPNWFVERDWGIF